MKPLPVLLCFVCVVVMGMLFIAAQWQLEIADQALIGGWDFKLIFNWFVFQDVWAIRDLWMLVMDLSFLSGMLFFGGMVNYAKN